MTTFKKILSLSVVVLFSSLTHADNVSAASSGSSLETLPAGQARLFLGRSFARDFYKDNSKFKFNIMSYSNGELMPFVQSAAGPNGKRSYYANLPSGEISLVVQAVNVANFGVRQGFPDKIDLDLKAGKNYQIVTGIESFKGLKTYSGLLDVSLSSDMFNECLKINEQKLSKKKRKNQLEETLKEPKNIAGCNIINNALPMPIVKKSYSKWVTKQQQNVLESLSRRELKERK